ncbi:CBS domain-containing protein [Streptomyces sp. BBFR109]|uniref:CBS domain-containing protein n=1 Tax=Streptomyces sp. BBFR109 TaxID=3448172 RepID=UPI003F7731FF
MTLVQMHPRSTTADAVQTAADPMALSGPQVWDSMTVEVALSVMAAARTGHLVICDEDGQHIGLVTLGRLTAVRDGSGYTDRIRLRDIPGGPGSASSPEAMPGAEHVMRHRLPGVQPLAAESGSAPGVLALSC